MGQVNSRKRKELSSSPQSTKKLKKSIAEEPGGHQRLQLQVEAFHIIWSKIESTIEVLHTPSLVFYKSCD